MQPLHAESSTDLIDDGGLPLRPYQEEAAAAVLTAPLRGVRRPLVALPTGTGKTVVFSHVIHRRGRRALVLAHREELLSQTIDKILAVDPSAQVGLVRAESDMVEAPIVVASVQTLSRPARLARLRPDFDTVVVDEAHHTAADTYGRVLDHVGAFTDAGPLTIGFTATPERGDGADLEAIFQEIVYTKSILEMIEAGYLADLRAMQIRLDADFRGLHTRAGDFIGRELEQTLLDADAPHHAAEAFLAHANGRKALIFTPTVEVAHAMAGAFQDAGVSAEALDGETDREERGAILGRLRDGSTRVVANCAVLTEGFDEPSVDCIIIARPTRSKPLYVQMIGRGTRLYPGKEDCLILDLVGSTTRHDLITAASTFGLRAAELERQTLAEAAAARRRAAGGTAAAGQLVAQAVDLFARRPLHWVQAANSFVLAIGDGWLRLEPTGQKWSVVRETRNRSRHLLAVGLDLGYAQGRAEDEARRLNHAHLSDPNAAWRRRPASEKQRDVLLKLGIQPRRMTAGEASDRITAVLAGPRR